MNQNLFLKQDYCFGIVTFENLFNLEIIFLLRRSLVIGRIIYQSIVDYISLIIGNNMNTKLLEIYKNSRNIFDEQSVDRSHHTLLY